jgi:hypothetical protein
MNHLLIVGVQDVAMNQDPGWDLSPRSLLGTLTPFRSMRRNAAAGETELGLLRNVFVSFCVAIVLISVVVIILGDLVEEDEPVGLSVVIVAGVGLASLIAGRRFRQRLDCSADAALVTSYRTRFFLRLAISEVVALVAFVVAISLGPWWVYFIGVPFTIVGFARLAPTQRNLEGDQNDLRANGCHRSLIQALNSASAAPPS